MSRLNQELGLLQGIALLATSLLGTGIFVVPALAASRAGDASLWAWPVLIALLLPVAFSFAQLGRHFPHAGGAPHLAGRAFGGRYERLCAWLFLGVLPVGLPAALQIASGFWRALGLGESGALAVELGTLLALALLGQRPARASGHLQAGIALCIIATVIAICWAGDLPASASLPPLDTGLLESLPGSLALLFWCFVGLEAFIHLGEEFRRPQRDFPLALLGGTLLAGLIYWACSLAVLHFHSYGDALRDAASLPNLLALLFGEHARPLAALLGYLACFASMNVYLQGFARLLWSLADEGKAPAALARRNALGVPGRALWLVVGCAALGLLAAHALDLPLDALLRLANGNFVLVYLLAMAAGTRLLHGPWRALALLATLICAGLLATLGQQALYALALVLLVLPPWSRLLPRRHPARVN